MADADMDCFLEYGTDPNEFSHQTEIMSMLAGDANMVLLEDLDSLNPKAAIRCPDLTRSPSCCSRDACSNAKLIIASTVVVATASVKYRETADFSPQEITPS